MMSARASASMTRTRDVARVTRDGEKTKPPQNERETRTEGVAQRNDACAASAALHGRAPRANSWVSAPEIGLVRAVAQIPLRFSSRRSALE